ncbi:hypothetical protein CEXT_360261 [Caerostris extrusa]|uniref:Uncharacterized protein n=1 Tax=Caerostris extrusa TaxID=172846 RepID=A0AAV4RUG4_CAEEX|nr:hypothetical protein CEXT_360261 [Caerostris extrusa]
MVAKHEVYRGTCWIHSSIQVIGNSIFVDQFPNEDCIKWYSWSYPEELFSAGISQTADVCDPSANMGNSQP